MIPPRIPDPGVVVLGGAFLEYLGRGPAFPEGGGLGAGEMFIEAPGGKGVVQAVAVSRLGGRAALIGRVGTDARAQAILHRLLIEGVESRHVLKDDEAPTGVMLVHQDEAGERRAVVMAGANAGVTPADVREATKTFAAAGVLLVSLEISLSTMIEALRVARGAGNRIILDPSPGVPLHGDILSRVDLLTPGIDEARVLTGVRVRHRVSAQRAADILLKEGVKAVAIPAGDEGVLLALPGVQHFFPKIPVMVADPWGAGDAFAAAMAVGLHEGKTWAEAGEFATAAAALATTRIGGIASMPAREAVLKLVEAVKGEREGKKDRRKAE